MKGTMLVTIRKRLIHIIFSSLLFTVRRLIDLGEITSFVISLIINAIWRHIQFVGHIALFMSSCISYFIKSALTFFGSINAQMWHVIRGHILFVYYISLYAFQIYRGVTRRLIKYLVRKFTQFPSALRNLFSFGITRVREVCKALLSKCMTLTATVVELSKRLLPTRKLSPLTSHIDVQVDYSQLALPPPRTIRLDALLRFVPILFSRLYIPRLPSLRFPSLIPDVRRYFSSRIFETAGQQALPFDSNAYRVSWSQMKFSRKLLVSVGVIVLFFGFGWYQLYVFVQGLPNPRTIGKVNYSLTTHLYDRNGESLYEFYKDANRTPIKLKDLPPYVYQATIAIEDKDFYYHVGVSPIYGVARAIKDWYTTGQVQGGSTITQQLVKMSLLSSERTFTRKIKEAVLALQAEKIFRKDQILEMYMNQVPYGGSAYGIEEASKTFFGKSAKDLTVSEAALLAGLPQSPTKRSPFTDPASAISRRDQVLLAMKEMDFITETEYVASINTTHAFRQPVTQIQAPHFVFYTKDILETNLSDVEIDTVGYNVRTTLDLSIQKMAQKILQEELDKVKYLHVTNGGVLVTRPSTGEILAMVGSAKYFDAEGTGAYNVTAALRQPGSTLKPLLYALALQKGYTAATLIDDTPTTFVLSRSDIYRPVNYDGRFRGRVTMRQSLANSYNVPAVKTIERIGVTNFIDFLRTAGIDSLEDYSHYGLSLSLGGGEVTMIDLSEAYGVLANRGQRMDLNPISSITNASGQPIAFAKSEPERVIGENQTYIVSDILSDNQARAAAFGYGSFLEIPGYKVAVKTGTTNDKKDNWTVGYTPDFLVTVWVGNNDGTPMNPYLTSGVTGAAPIWNRVMSYLLNEKGKLAKHWYEKPTSILTKACLGREELFVSGTENSVPCVIITPKPLVKNEGGHDKP